MSFALATLEAAGFLASSFHALPEHGSRHRSRLRSRSCLINARLFHPDPSLIRSPLIRSGDCFECGN